MNLNENSAYNNSKFESCSTTNKIFNKSISFASTITKTNNTSNSTKDLNNIQEKLNKCFDIDIKNNNNKFLHRSKSKNNYYINNCLFKDKTSKEKKLYFSSCFNYKIRNINDLLLNNLNEIKYFENRKKNINLKNNIIKKSRSKPILNDYITEKNEVMNLLLNRYPNIEKHRKNKFNQEINYVIKDIKTELNTHNNKLLHVYSHKNIMNPFKIIPKNNFNYSTVYNDEDIYKFNIMAKSKILNINDIKQKNIQNFFNFGKIEKYKRSSSLENLNLIINNKLPKYISDYYYNNKFEKPSIKIVKYKSNKLHEIYDSLNNL